MREFIKIAIIILVIIGSLFLAGFIQRSLGATLDNNTVLELAQKSLAAKQNQNQNQNQSSATQIAADTGNLKDASEITKLSGLMSKYENSDYGISINFPNNWKQSEINLPQHGIVIFNAPELGDVLSEGYVFDPASVLVASQKLPVNNMTLSEFVNSFLKDRYLNVTDYKIIQPSKSSLGGMDSEKIIMYEYDALFPGAGLMGEGRSVKLMRNIAVDHKTDTAYMFKYAAHPGTFSKYLPLADQMMNSFVLTK